MASPRSLASISFGLATIITVLRFQTKRLGELHRMI
jgi:hypothetical protein